MDTVVGTCGRCGGPVTIPSVWGGIIPPTPTCGNCGAIPAETHGPVMPMKDGPVFSIKTDSTG